MTVRFQEALNYILIAATNSGRKKYEVKQANGRKQCVDFTKIEMTLICTNILLKDMNFSSFFHFCEK